MGLRKQAIVWNEGPEEAYATGVSPAPSPARALQKLLEDNREALTRAPLDREALRRSVMLAAMAASVLVLTLIETAGGSLKLVA